MIETLKPPYDELQLQLRAALSLVRKHQQATRNDLNDAMSAVQELRMLPETMRVRFQREIAAHFEARALEVADEIESIKIEGVPEKHVAEMRRLSGIGL